jgi:hypothetical protein
MSEAQAFYDKTCKVGLTWNGVITNMYWDLDDMLPWFGCDARHRSMLMFFASELQEGAPYYMPNYLNIYFHGNMRFNQEGQQCGYFTVVGNTVDPGDAIPEIRAHILINDRAGILPNSPGIFQSGDRVLQHELAHWFLRQRSSQGGRYDESEHTNDSSLLMRGNMPHGPNFFENVQIGICERYEIWTKALTWNQPEP